MENRQYKIALIEDDKVLSNALADELESSDINVVRAFDGEEGFELVKREKPDLVLLDIIMPKLDGISLLKKLKENEETKNVPVVMLTVFGDYQKIADTLDLGAKAYFIKDQQKMSSVVDSVKSFISKDIAERGINKS